MNISSLINFNSINNNMKTSPALKPAFKGGLSKDTVSFTSKLKSSFESKAAAVEYYKNIANAVNTSLDEEDELTAFETLGYDVEADFDTDEITINGDYTPYFEIFTGSSRCKHLVTYEEAGIDQKRLLQNVKEITGKKLVSPHFVPGDDFEIDKTIIYPTKVEERLIELLEKRCDKARAALAGQDSFTALKTLGYNVSEDENGKITIDGDYSAILMLEGAGRRSILDYDIDENELLKDVVKINGSAQFTAKFEPDHYIEAEDVSTINGQARSHSGYNIKMMFEELSPKFQKTVADVKAALEENDSLKALRVLGYNASCDENGNITIDGDYRTGIKSQDAHTNYMYAPTFRFSQYGIDEEQLLQNVTRITGNFVIHDTSMQRLKPDLTVEGNTLAYRRKAEELFAGFSNESDIAALYDLDPIIISTFARQGTLTPSYKTDETCYFNGVSDSDKQFLDELSQKRETVLTAKEIQEQYGVSDISIRNSLKDKTLIPYHANIDGERYNLNTSYYMYDMSAPENQAAVKKFKANRKSTEQRQALKSSVSDNNFRAACIKNGVPCESQSIRAFSADDLEHLGYGTKADLIANCSLRKNAFEIKQYILNNDVYDISTAIMMDIVQNARRNNPALVKLSDLQKYTGDVRENFRIGVASDKLNIITEHPYRLASQTDYCVNLADEKNLEFLRSIGGEAFQTWLSGKMEAYEEYRAENDRKLEEFKAIDKPPTEQERSAEIQKQLDEIQEQRRAAAKEKQLLAKQKQDEISRNLSLRNTIAWVMCPETRRVRKENITSRVQDIFRKNRQAEKLYNKLMEGEITPEEAQKMLKKLNLSKEDEIAVYSYYKTCWDISGTEEWKNALAAAKPLVEAYNIFGLSGIEDPEIRERLARWEKEKGISEE